MSERDEKTWKTERFPLTPAEIRGHRVVGSILEWARLNQPEGWYSHRQWVDHVATEGRTYSHSLVQRYERLGEVQDSRGVARYRLSNRDYLKDCARFTPYSFQFLWDVANGRYTPDDGAKPPMLSELIANYKNSVTEYEYEQRRQRWAIDQGILDRAETGEITERDAVMLAGFLDTGIEKIWEASVASRDRRINGA